MTDETWWKMVSDTEAEPVTCPEFVDDGVTRRCGRCGWWRSTHMAPPPIASPLWGAANE